MTAEHENTASETIRILLTGALNVDNEIALLLITNGFTTVGMVADAPTGTIASIDEFNESIEVELLARAHNWLAQNPKKTITSVHVAQGNIAPALPHLRRGRGRPPTGNRKVPTTLRIDSETLSRLRATGSGWQIRAGQGLKELLDEGRI